MRYLRIGILLLLPLASQAQTITLGPITKLAYCLGDTLLVPYTATGTFSSDNHFFVELSDANGSFASYIPIGSNAAETGTIAVPLNSTGMHFLVKAASTHPYDTSVNNGSDIEVFAYPSPIAGTVSPHQKKLGPISDDPFLKAVGLIGTDIVFTERSIASTGFSFSWQFDSSANPGASSTDTSTIEFSSEGSKSASLTLTNPGGCTIIDSFKFRVLSCNPTIPANANVITTTESGPYPEVWVRSGGHYVTNADVRPQFVYVEPGGALTIGDQANGVYYIREGASVTLSGTPAYLAAVLPMGVALPNNINNQEYFDTFYCPSLSFNYSNLGINSAELESSSLYLHQSSSHLSAQADGGSIDVKLFNVLGEEILSQRGMGEIDLDLSSIPVGVYFAIAQAGGERLTRRIAVVR